MPFFPLYLYFIAAGWLVSLSIFYKSKNSPFYLKIFSAFLFLTLLEEVLALYLNSIGKTNIPLYNFFTAFEFCFYLWIINLVINSSRVKTIIKITIVLYAFLATVNILFIQKIKTFHTVTYSLGCLLIVIFCIYYFLELFRLPKSTSLTTNPAFWICSGLLFFYCCGFPLYGLINYWSNISKLVVTNFDRIFTILNIFLYTLFTIAFLCVRARKYTLSSS